VCVRVRVRVRRVCACAFALRVCVCVCVCVCVRENINFIYLLFGFINFNNKGLRRLATQVREVQQVQRVGLGASGQSRRRANQCPPRSYPRGRFQSRVEDGIALLFTLVYLSLFPLLALSSFISFLFYPFTLFSLYSLLFLSLLFLSLLFLSSIIFFSCSLVFVIFSVFPSHFHNLLLHAVIHSYPPPPLCTTVGV
jgi:hypothetical protein